MRPGDRAALKTPRAAAVAGIIFAALLLVSLSLLLRAVQVRPTDPGIWLGAQAGSVALALNLIPFAGVAFLWFVGVLRSRLGGDEDQLFATVFLGSGVLFVGLLFVSASVFGAILHSASVSPADFTDTPTFRFARALAYSVTTLYALKMAAVFMITASTLVVRTRFTARWVAIVGYIASAVIIFSSQTYAWTVLLFPGWVLLISGNILVEEFRHGRSNSQETDT